MKLIPHDRTIREFSNYLPAEIEFQKDHQVESEEEDEYYDEEDEEPDQKEGEAKIYELTDKEANEGEDPDAAAVSTIGEEHEADKPPGS